jgi:hypothetical protein
MSMFKTGGARVTLTFFGSRKPLEIGFGEMGGIAILGG